MSRFLRQVQLTATPLHAGGLRVAPISTLDVHSVFDFDGTVRQR